MAGHCSGRSGATTRSTPRLIELAVITGPTTSRGEPEIKALTNPITMAAYKPEITGSPATVANAMHCGIATKATVRPAKRSADQDVLRGGRFRSDKRRILGSPRQTELPPGERGF
jgi:hypothetical protein